MSTRKNWGTTRWCVICKAREVTPRQSHNADPIAQGRCCSVCNDVRVLPVRLSEGVEVFAQALRVKFGVDEFGQPIN